MGKDSETKFMTVGENVEYAETSEHYVLRIPKTAQGRPSHAAPGQVSKSSTLATTPGKFGFNVPGLDRTSITLRMSKWTV